MQFEIWSPGFPLGRYITKYYMGGCQNHGPFLDTLNSRCRIIIGIQKGTINLTTTHMQVSEKWGTVFWVAIIGIMVCCHVYIYIYGPCITLFGNLHLSTLNPKPLITRDYRKLSHYCLCFSPSRVSYQTHDVEKLQDGSFNKVGVRHV